MGAGFTLPVSYSSQTWEVSGGEGDASLINVGAGFVLDTNLSIDEIFNYRFQFSGEYTKLDSDVEDADGFRLVVLNSFGFKVYKKDTIKLWIGPQLGGYYLHGEDYNGGGGLIGFILGLNVNTAGNITFGVDFGLRAVIGGGGAGNVGIFNYGVEGFSNLNVMFRFDE